MDNTHIPYGIYRLLSQKRQMVGTVYSDTNTDTSGISLCLFSGGNHIFISRIAGLVISSSLIAVLTLITLVNPVVYDTVILTCDAESEVYFDDSYTVYLSDESFGTLDVDVHKGETEKDDFYLLHALLKKAGKTDVIIKSPNGEKIVYEIDIRRNTFDLVKKQ